MVIRSASPARVRTPASAKTTGTHRPPGAAGLDPRLLAVAGAASLSLTAIFTKLTDASTATIVFYRCLIAVVPLAFLAYAEVKRRGALPSRRTVAIQALGGAFLGIDFALFTQAIMLVGAGVSTILNNVQVLVVPLLAWAFFRDRIPLKFVAAVPVMFAGIAMAGGLVGGAPAPGADPLLGTLLGLASGVAYAGYIIIIGRTGSRSGPNCQVLISTAMAGIVGSVAGTAFGGIDFTPGWDAIGWLAALALVGQVLGWVLIGSALPRLKSQVGASMLLLQPVLAIVFAMLMIGERPTPLQLLGCVIVIGVVAAVSRAPKPKARSRRKTGIDPIEVIEQVE